VLSLSTSCPTASAQQVVTVTATRNPAPLAEVLADVSVLDREAIARTEARTLAEVLSQLPGLQFAANGGLGKTASIFVRGLEARHTLLLVDGVRIGSATVGTPSLDNLPLEAIERIEVVRGPLSSLYGNGAMGGVIQVFTRRGVQGLSANAKLGAGSGRYGVASAGAGFGDGRFDAAAQLQYTTQRGQSATNPAVPFGSYNDDRDGWKQSAGSARIGYAPAKGWRVEAVGLASRGDTDLDDGPGAPARARLTNRTLALSATGELLPSWRSKLAASGATDGYDTRASASAFATLGAIETRTRHLTWENTVATPLGSVQALAERLTEKVSRPGQPFSVSERDIDAVAFGLNGSAGAHTWQGSVRRDRSDQFGGVTTGALGYGFAFTPAWRLSGSVATSHTLPSFNQLYFPNFGSPNLLPEEGRHAELGLRWSEGVHSARLSIYRHEYRGFITSGPQPANLPKAEIDGATLAWEGRVAQALELQASIDHTNPRNATAGNANFDKVLPRRAKNALRLGAAWDAAPWRAGATLAAFSHRFDDSANTARLGGYATLDLFCDFALAPGLSLGGRVNNVADKRYQTVRGYNQPPREAFLTLRWEMR
jgi:vitamin B12 transporter